MIIRHDTLYNKSHHLSSLISPQNTLKRERYPNQTWACFVRYPKKST